jgi:hypothetical protein
LLRPYAMDAAGHEWRPKSDVRESSIANLKVPNWQQCAYLFDAPIDVKTGQVVVINAAHNRALPWFWHDNIVC